MRFIIFVWKVLISESIVVDDLSQTSVVESVQSAVSLSK